MKPDPDAAFHGDERFEPHEQPVGIVRHIEHEAAVPRERSDVRMLGFMSDGGAVRHQRNDRDAKENAEVLQQ